MREQNYFIKIVALLLATAAGLFAIWYALVRQESVDWISSQVMHQPSPYAVTELDGGLIISNVILGYEFKAPLGFKTLGARNLILFMENGGVKQCQIKHYRSETKAAAAPGKAIIPFKGKELVFELANQEEINDCGRYLLEIKNSFLFD